MRSAMIKHQLHSAGVPDVTQVWAHEIGASRMLIALGIKQQYAGHAKQVGALAASCGAAVYGCKMVIVVDDDIDVSNLEQLMWATLSRCDPATSVDILRRMRSTPADPRLTPEQRKARDFTNSRMVIDATRPYDWRDKFPKVNAPSREIARKAREKFGHLLR
jgi:4-hydroxy-3-polyprenylbenzoate decarboxylase